MYTLQQRYQMLQNNICDHMSFEDHIHNVFSPCKKQNRIWISPFVIANVSSPLVQLVPLTQV
jgi:hypothetical protein